MSMVTDTQAGVKQLLFDKMGFKSTGPEQQAIIDCDKRFVLIAGGERSGKSNVVSALVVWRVLQDEPGGLYWLVAKDYPRTEAEFFYIKGYLQRLNMLDEKKSTSRVDPGHIVMKDGTRFETKHGNDPTVLGVKAPNGIIPCEAAQLDLIIHERLSGRLLEKRGWMLSSGTFEGSLGWYPSLWKEWRFGDRDHQSFSLPTPSNRVIFPLGEADPEFARLREEHSDEYYAERIMGVPVPPEGLVFKEFRLDLHVRENHYVPGEPVYITNDPGYGSESANALEIAHRIEGQVRVFDEIFVRGKITDEIIDICETRPWWNDVQYLSVDPHYRDQHHAQVSVAETWLKRTGLVAGPRDRIRIPEGTERLKGFLRVDPVTYQPRIIISPRCTGVLSEFGIVPNPFDGQTRVYQFRTDRDGNTTGKVPEDKNNHGIKALIYLVVDRFGYGYSGLKKKVKVIHHNGRTHARGHRRLSSVAR